MAAEGSRMSNTRLQPPRAAEALLRSILTPSDFESISGDLLEEYREVRRPSLGRLRADAWYGKQVLSMLWRLVWPCLLAITALRLLTLVIAFDEGKVVRLWWNPSVVPAPGVALLDALVYLLAGMYGSQRTGLIKTGVVTATATTIVGFSMFFIWAALRTPRLLLAPFEQPFVFVILFILLGIALGFGLIAGTAGAALGRRLPPSRWRARTT
jgi:hypothetical protein